MAKRKRKTNSRTNIYLMMLGALMILIGIAMMNLLSSFSYVPDGSIVQLPDRLSLDFGEGLISTDAGNYSGLFMEDGTDDAVSNVMRMVVKNTSEKDLQYAELEVVYGAEVREFTVSNLPSGKSCVLLEKNRQSYIDGQPVSYTANHVVFFEESMNLMQDKFEITGEDGILNVKNISDRDISGDVVVYYKYAADDLYYGGITFRIKVSGGLKQDEIRQIPAGHFDKESSVLTMVTCNE